MNKKDLIAAVSVETDVQKADVNRIVEAFFAKIGETLTTGGEVQIVNFGTFFVGQRKRSAGRNPRTGEQISIAPIMQPRFRPGRMLKKAVRRS